MSRDENDDTTTYQVVVNHEEQYSIWPSHKEMPPGWVAKGPQGSKRDCLDYIKDVWVDMRPLSLRSAMDAEDSHVPDAPLRAPID